MKSTYRAVREIHLFTVIAYTLWSTETPDTAGWIPRPVVHSHVPEFLRAASIKEYETTNSGALPAQASCDHCIAIRGKLQNIRSQMDEA